MTLKTEFVSIHFMVQPNKKQKTRVKNAGYSFSNNSTKFNLDDDAMQSRR
jgi:hypothetical protein